MNIRRLRLTHIEKASDYPRRWYIRFTGDDPEFVHLCAELKRLARERWHDSHWEASKEWDDGKRGGWCVSDFILNLYSGCFDNFVEMMGGRASSGYSTYTRSSAGAWSYWEQSSKPRLPGPVAQAFRLLNLEASATAEEVKKAYRKCALANHPDHHMMKPASVRDAYTEKLKQINRAKETIDQWFAKASALA